MSTVDTFDILGPDGEPIRTAFCHSGEHEPCTADWCRCDCHDTGEEVSPR